MTFIETMRQKASSLGRKLVLPEGIEPRTIQAACTIIQNKIASKVFLVGNPSAIQAKAEELSADLTGVILIDPKTDARLESYAAKLYDLRKAKGMTLDQAKVQIQEVLWFGAMMVRMGDADAMVAGADNSTGNVLKASIPVVGTAPGIKYVSSCFVMDFADKKWGKDGLMIFADCAVIPVPDPAQLAEITLAAADSCRTFLQVEPIIAMLSFSTKGSASHPVVDKVTQALALVKEKSPQLQVDGELQADAALVASVAAKKAPGSSVAGHANTLIFPDLGVGNIGYKMVQRFAGAEAYGPFLQGFAKPVSDLSRGCSIDDIVNTAAVTLCQTSK